jgi:hypothetical protein
MGLFLDDLIERIKKILKIEILERRKNEK